MLAQHLHSAADGSHSIRSNLRIMLSEKAEQALQIIKRVSGIE